MSHIRLRCTRCGARHAADMATLACRDCGAPLDVEYLDAAGGIRAGLAEPVHGAGVSLGEGNTPHVPLTAAGVLLGLRQLYGKLEYLNPTGSFKDRGTAAMMTVAIEHGVTEVVEDSSGNAGASVSAYAARAGVKAHIFAPAGAAPAKLRQIRAHGAQVHSIEGPSDAATKAAMGYQTEHRLVYASHALSPYFLEGIKAFSYEVVQHFDGELPAHIVFPVGNGTLFIGAYKGFEELRRSGHIAEVPRHHCVQARAVMPIVAAYNGEVWDPHTSAQTAAEGIAVGAPVRAEQVLEILRATGGMAVAVEEAQVSHWRRALAEKEGIFAESTSAAALAGVAELVEQGAIGPADRVLVPITGSGLKDALWP